ncbi:MAG TPA: ferredoxin family protein [Polyangiaceae bacterium]
MSTLSWVKEIHIDVPKCTGCMACVDACFVDVIHWDQENRTPVAAYPEDCVWCLACEIGCPVQIIDVIPQVPAPLKRSY